MIKELFWLLGKQYLCTMVRLKFEVLKKFFKYPKNSAYGISVEFEMKFLQHCNFTEISFSHGF